jgi:hypothetical protein
MSPAHNAASKPRMARKRNGKGRRFGNAFIGLFYPVFSHHFWDWRCVKPGGYNFKTVMYQRGYIC